MAVFKKILRTDSKRKEIEKLRSLKLSGKYILAEAAIAVFEIVFGLLSSCMAMSALGLYSLVGIFCVASVEIFPKTKLAYTGFLALVLGSALFAWYSVYSVHLTIGYANDAVDLWGIVPPIILFFVKVSFYMLCSEDEEFVADSALFGEIVDYKYDLLMILSTILALFLTFVFDFYIEYIVALGITLCCIRKVFVTAKIRDPEAKK